MSEIFFVATCAATTPPCKSWKRDSNPHGFPLAPKASAAAITPFQHEMVGEERFERSIHKGIVF